jgi:hypothetical protein
MFASIVNASLHFRPATVNVAGTVDGADGGTAVCGLRGRAFEPGRPRTLRRRCAIRSEGGTWRSAAPATPRRGRSVR